MYLTHAEAETRTIIEPILKKILNTTGALNYQKITSANAFVYCIDNSYIKFPTSMKAEKALRREISISNFLSNRVSFSVPYFSYGQITATINHKECNLFYATSQKIRGIPLYQATMRAIPHESFTHSLSSTLNELHSIPTEEMSTLKIPTFNARLGKIIHATIQSTDVSLQLKKQLVKKIRTHLGNEKDVLCHRDLHGANVFVNPMTGHVTGLLDFGMAELAPPAIEISDFGVYANPHLTSKIKQLYTLNSSRTLGDLYLYHAGDRNKWLQKLIISGAKELNIPIKIDAQKIIPHSQHIYTKH
ncbi:MAG: aminoglycoside phosphotransferase family protein [Alphaproteobacteria bacterium]|nr:aminoglycoside phosphotransferase family protein [Alphaproteobacteria bacterium]